MRRLRETAGWGGWLAGWRSRLGGFRRLRSKITFAYLALFALLLIGILSAVYSSIEHNAERAVRHELDASGVVFDRIWQMRTAELHDAANLLVQDFGFRGALATRDAPTIRSALQNLSHRAGVDVVFALDSDGEVIAADGLSAAKLGQLRSLAADDDDATGIFVVDGVAYQAAVAPVLAPTPVGKVVFAARLDRQELQALARLSPIPLEPHLLLRRPDGRWAQTEPGVDAAELANAARAFTTTDPRAHSARHVGSWVEVARPLHSLGPDHAALLLRYPLSAALAPYRGLLALLLGLAVAGLAAAAVGGAMLAGEVTRPISRLKDATERLEHGEDVQVPVEGRDEIAVLSQAFNQMTGEIRRRETALEAARREAESASQAKSDFLANMSHEFRTPLNGILGMAQVMLHEADPAQQGRARVIKSSGEALLAILNSILDLSKIEAGQLEVEPSDFDLEAAMSAACDPFANLAHEKRLGFRLEIEPQARGFCRGDPLRLRQVLVNLASNAVKFTAAGGIVVTARRDGDVVSFAVRDTGPGITPDKLEQIFERFTQADNSSTRSFGGAGLGLSICRELVKAMGGRMRVESRPGEGSTFGFDLPLPTREPPAEAAAADMAPGAEGPEGEDRPVRILAAEDNPTNALILKALLEPVGVDLVIVGDGAQAVEAFGLADYDVVLMDIQMPVMNGVDATRAIRRDEAERGRLRTPILAVSANVMDHQVADYVEAGMDHVVAKPIQAEILYAAIEGALTQTAHRAAA